MKNLVHFAFALGATAFAIRNQDNHPVPFINTTGHSSELIPNEYMVHLDVGYTFKQHFDTIRLDMSVACEEYFELKQLWCYHCRIADDSIIHEIVREDKNVEFVQQNVFTYQDFLEGPIKRDLSATALPIEQGHIRGQDNHPVPFVNDTRDGPTPIPNAYMVQLRVGYTFKQHFDTIKTDMSTACESYFESEEDYAYYCRVADESIIHEKVREDKNVEFVEQDCFKPAGESNMKGQADREKMSRDEPDYRGRFETFHEWTRLHTTWNLAMISAKGKEEYTAYDRYDYPIFDKPGLGVNIYILDTGVKTAHKSFQNHHSHGGESDIPKIRNFKNAKDTDQSRYRAGTFEDHSGHGTHVASIAAGGDAYFRYMWFGLGVAHYATIVNVPVIDAAPKRAGVYPKRPRVVPNKLAQGKFIKA